MPESCDFQGFIPNFRPYLPLPPPPRFSLSSSPLAASSSPLRQSGLLQVLLWWCAVTGITLQPKPPPIRAALLPASAQAAPRPQRRPLVGYVCQKRTSASSIQNGEGLAQQLTTGPAVNGHRQSMADQTPGGPRPTGRGLRQRPGPPLRPGGRPSTAAALEHTPPRFSGSRNPLYPLQHIRLRPERCPEALRVRARLGPRAGLPDSRRAIPTGKRPRTVVRRVFVRPAVRRSAPGGPPLRERHKDVAHDKEEYTNAQR